ncbi:glycosyltransferase family 4 protein [Mucilaginibacter sp.]|uniref:glycosyltransferase family 4 protein n=1 Tax=Mucilaginibacter sp. TaxID=1882438 RepID=UPI00283BF6F5|nr:glycosyltransferase family 4 protein [Mucilaginibacter sp.]MDR3697538.1 glycosyltransferase family 4 protein [Mucilaginibacter sp.]
MKIIISHPTGNQNVRALLLALLANGMLAEFETTLAVNQRIARLSILPFSLKKELSRRIFPLPPKFIRSYPLLEISRFILPKLKLGKFTKGERGWASIDAIYQHLDSLVAKRLCHLPVIDMKAVYNYEDGALATFKKAKSLGLKCIYDLPIAYWETGRRLLTEEAERLPVWAATLGGGIGDSQKKLDRKTGELELADVVIVASQFVKDSLPSWANHKKIIISPFGTPVLPNEISNIEGKSPERPLRVMFAGSMGQRKGLGDLFAAMKLLNRRDVELVVMGTLQAPMEFYREEYADFIYEPGRPNDEVLALMRTCDVFCLPSIVEGRALVMQEAMSQGLPLIITPNTGGEDLIINGETGFLVPIRSPESIAEKITWFLENRSKAGELGKAAQLHAQKYTWENYGNGIIEAIKTFINN